MDAAVISRFWRKVDRGVPGGCWLWTDKGNGYGYGRLRVDGRNILAHRFSYELHVGPIPPGLELDHLCRVRACVRPDHLEAVTHAENVRRGTWPSALNAVKTHCKSGHEFNDQNTYIRPDGYRDCRVCDRGRVARYTARKKAA